MIPRLIVQTVGFVRRTPSTSLSTIGTFETITNTITPLLPAFLTDAKLDNSHKNEMRRLSDFHNVAALLDRKAKPTLFPPQFRVDLDSFDAPDELTGENFSALLQDIMETAISKREEAEVKIDEFAYALTENESTAERTDVKRLLCVTMRLRLVQHFCESLIATNPAHGSDRKSALSKWQSVATSLRVQHGVWVSLPALLYRSGLTASAGQSEASIRKAILLDVVNSCLYGGYDDRVLSMSKYFSECCVDVEEGLLWKEFELVLKTISETTALTLREELLTFVGFNEKHPAVMTSLKEIENNDIVKTVEVITEAKTSPAADIPTTETVESPPSDKTTDIVGIADPVADPVVKWSVAYPAEKEERKSILTHARIWLLHDFDYIQKWRCSFAWAHKLTEAEMERNKLDFFGVALLEGATSVEEVIASQKLNFNELGGFSQHFSAAYKTKRMEKYTEKKSNRETARIGTVFIIAVALLDSFIIEK